jgi:PAS domain S-box-containing protein
MKLGPKFLHSLFEVAHVEFQAYDLSNHKVVFSSGVARQLLGYTEQEYADLSAGFYQTIIHPDDAPIVQQTIEKVLQSKDGEVVDMTVRLRKVDGAYIWLYSRQMIYERKHHDQTLTIIREVEDVTQLVELQNSLKEKFKQLNTISYKNSHLLRSPVASIIGLVGLIEEHEITSEHNRQVLTFLKETIIKLDSMIHEINDIAQSH